MESSVSEDLRNKMDKENAEKGRDFDIYEN